MGSMIAGAKMALTERQRQLVSLLTQGLKNKEIAGAMGVTEASVKVYVNLLLHKLGLRTRLELALYGRKRGFVAEDGRGLLDPEILTPKVELAGVADLLEAPAVGTAVFGSEQVQRRVLEQRSRPCAREARGPAPCERRHPAMPRAPLAARRNCTCGLCPKCRDNARWERIYQAKFEDPNYYRKGPAAFIRSGLSDIGG
jgi:DNA-binding CsgD family transcriptional regulator